MKVKLNGNDFFSVTADFGVTDFIHKTPHTGIDLSMLEGTKLFSPTDGIISRIVDYGNENIGKGIIIKTKEGESLIMGHLSDTSNVSIGQRISEGQFLGLSGNTGLSTGGHLHLGLRDANGSFVNPDKFLSEHGGVMTKFMGESGSKGMDGGLIDFISDWRESGSFFEAMYGKTFFETMKDFFIQLISEMYTYIITNGDLFFILPAILIMFATFIIGKNKFTKWIIPLWFAFFVSKILVMLNCLPPQ